MATAESIVIPGNSQTGFERPYNKGIVLNVPPQMVAEGACLEAKNLVATGGGLKRRPGTKLFNSLAASYPPWQALDSFWSVSGVQKLIAMDQKFVYEITLGTTTGLYWEYAPGTSHVTTTAGSTAVAADIDTHWNDSVNELGYRDVLVYGATYEFADEITSITNGTALVLTSGASGSYHGANWKIRRSFGATQPYIVDSVVITGGTPKILFADSSRFLYSYNGTDFTDYNAAETDLIPSCVTYFKNRVWIANIFEGGQQCRQRIRWTELGDLDDFTNGGYLDLPYVKGEIKRLVPLGDFLVAFFDDAIYVGRQTNLLNLPLSFQKLETGGVGLLGMRAVTSWIDSLFFVGQDDIYALSPNGLAPIGTPIVKRSIVEVAPTRHWKICAATDLLNDRVLFGFPKDTNEIEAIWSFNYKTKAWTWEDINCHMLATNSWVNSLTWETFVSQDYDTGHVTTVLGDATLVGNGTDWVTAFVVAAGDSVLVDTLGTGNYDFATTVLSVTNLTTLEMVDVAPADAALVHYRIVKAAATWAGSELAGFPTWESIKGSSTTIKDVYILKHDTIWKYVVDSNNDEGTAIGVELITRDMDYNLPDDEKLFYQFGVKLETWVTSNLDFIVQASNDRGQHWKPLGTLRILADHDEGAVNFRMRGSCVRFRLTSVADIAPYVLNEITMKVRVLGGEVPGREDS
jgi:hypothetical protein